MIQFGTLILVGLSGLGSFLQTEHLSASTQIDRDRALKEIHDLYDRMHEIENRQLVSMENQKVSIENQKKLLESNSKQLDNQSKILDNQGE